MVRKIRLYLPLALASVMTAMLLAGCHTVVGGGWMLSATGSGKATFGMELYCQNDTVSGYINYIDHPLGLHIIGTPDGTALNTWCGDNDNVGEFYGVYEVPNVRDSEGNKVGGRFGVRAYDTGLPGPSKGDWMRITLTGYYEGYENYRVLGGGNIDRIE